MPAIDISSWIIKIVVQHFSIAVIKLFFIIYLFIFCNFVCGLAAVIDWPYWLKKQWLEKGPTWAGWLVTCLAQIFSNLIIINVVINIKTRNNNFFK